MAEFDHALILTTPPITGQRVKDAQWLLSGHNVFSKDAHPIAPFKDVIDGVYGPKTAAASKLAKYQLGYPSDNVDSSFGQILYNLLTGKTELPIDYAHRRQERIAFKSLPEKAVDYALSQVGYHESPYGSNLQKYGQWYGFNGVPWCAIFVSYCLWAVGYKTPQHTTWKYSYVPFISDGARNGTYGMRFTSNPRKGDLVCYTVHGVRNAHVGFFHSWNVSGKTFYDVAGNTSHTNQANGGEVAKSLYDINHVTSFVRLG